MTESLFGSGRPPALARPGTPVLTIHRTAASPPGDRLDGFKWWWLKSVRGVNGRLHCAMCLVGGFAKAVKKNMLVETPVALDEFRPGTFDFLYLCGVRGAAFEKTTKRWISSYDENFHLPLRAKEGARAELLTYNGYRVEVVNAESMLPIAELPPGWHGIERKRWSCRNFQFGVQHYGDTTVGYGVNL